MENKVLDSIGDKIYNLRKQKNISQDELVEYIGVTRQTVSKWEANRSQPKLENLRQICECLGVELKYFTNDNSFVEDFNIEQSNLDNSAIELEAQSLSNDENEIRQIVASDEAIEEVEEIKLSNDVAKPQKLSKFKILIVTTLIITIIMGLIGMIVLIINSEMKSSSSDGEFDSGYSSVTWNYNIENLGWILFGIASVVIVVLISLIVINNYKNKNKK